MNVLLQLPLARLTRTPRAWIPIAAWTLFALGAAIVLHRAGPSSAGEALQSLFGALALPLLAYAVVGATLGADGLARSVRSLVSFGAPPGRAALAEVLVATAASAVVAAVVGIFVAVLAHGSGDPPLVRDAFATAWIAALGGAAYASLFAFGASLGKHGGGRAWVLVLDWVLGAGSGSVGFVTPRAHLRSLLGGDAVASCSNATSAAMLFVLGVAFASLAVARARRA